MSLWPSAGNKNCHFVLFISVLIIFQSITEYYTLAIHATSSRCLRRHIKETDWLVLTYCKQRKLHSSWDLNRKYSQKRTGRIWPKLPITKCAMLILILLEGRGRRKGRGKLAWKLAIKDPLLPVLFSLARCEHLSSSVNPSWSIESSQIKKDGWQDQLLWKLGKIIEFKKLEWGPIFPGFYCLAKQKSYNGSFKQTVKYFFPLKCIDC